MDLLWVILAILVLAVGIRAFSDLFRRVVEAIIYTGVGLVILLFILKYHTSILGWITGFLNRVIGH